MREDDFPPGGRAGGGPVLQTVPNPARSGQVKELLAGFPLAPLAFSFDGHIDEACRHLIERGIQR
jgi:hypothetical protein